MKHVVGGGSGGGATRLASPNPLPMPQQIDYAGGSGGSGAFYIRYPV